MSNYGWLIAGGAALTGAVGVFWGYVKALWAWISGHIVVHAQVQGTLEEAVSMYFWQNFKTSPWGKRNYIGRSLFVRPAKRHQLVTMEIISQSGRLYWLGWRPVWVARADLKEKNQNRVGEGYHEGGLTFAYLRGMFNLDELLITATKEYNKAWQEEKKDTTSRYFIQHIFGTDGKPANLRPDAPQDFEGTVNWTRISAQQNRLLQWKPNDLGPFRLNSGKALDYMALDKDTSQMVEEVQHWKTSESWYKDRGIPWRRGWLLYGEPGTGKTSITRAIAEDFNLPIYVFHLATLFDNELQEAWSKMQGSVPCIALIEDIDTVFHGRANTANGHLTFDCLLNCLDGIGRSDGILLVITTNKLEHLDPALGIPSGNGSTRPGRLDQILEMKPLDAKGRLKLCTRILEEYPDMWADTIAKGEGETGAQFQGRCTQLALERFWNEDQRTN